MGLLLLRCQNLNQTLLLILQNGSGQFLQLTVRCKREIIREQMNPLSWYPILGK
uniref:Uncharacterized protein n=1 Tax=Arundo donax TaxID=35708 RepID=A0A0A9ED26_ARUDO